MRRIRSDISIARDGCACDGGIIHGSLTGPIPFIAIQDAAGSAS
jgi:hypothetical protein